MSTSSIYNQSVEPVTVQSSKSELDGLIEMLDLSDLQKHFMVSRWMGQVKWMEGKASMAKKRFYTLRLTTIIGGVLVPILISLNFNNPRHNHLVRWISISLGGLVAVSSAVEEFLKYGESWQHYRRTAESLKIQGWQFSQLSGVYNTCQTHQQAFPIFASQVEDLLQQDVQVYMTQVVQEKKEDKDSESEQKENQAN
ncbi:MAG TPA: DUF4231 domain-containing protein [Cyanobacteria bacterium UBA8553]|nr:DUF4231 domain-containing protein [Cyanobacteria bacterium UBA8553]HAJ64418.1 DUF4231 domain-containing protein [Cyanobacteria bacterium UBA8543]